MLVGLALDSGTGLYMYKLRSFNFCCFSLFKRSHWQWLLLSFLPSPTMQWCWHGDFCTLHACTGPRGGGGKGAMLQEQCMPILVPCLSCLFHCTKRYLQLIEFCNKRPWFKPFTSDFAHEMLIHSFCLKDLFIRISRYRFIVTADSIFTGHLVWHYP